MLQKLKEFLKSIKKIFSVKLNGYTWNDKKMTKNTALMIRLFAP